MDHAIIRRTKLIWWALVSIQVIYLIVPDLIFVSSDEVEKSQESLEMATNALFLMSFIVLVLSFWFPRWLIKTSKEKLTMDNFLVASAVSLGLTTAISVYAMTLGCFSLKEEGLMLAGVAFILMGLRYPRPSYIERLMGPEFCKEHKISTK